MECQKQLICAALGDACGHLLPSLAPWVRFWQMGFAQTLLAPFAGKRWDKLLPMAHFPGEALLMQQLLPATPVPTT